MKKTTRKQALPPATAASLIAMGFLAMITGLTGAAETRIYKSIAEDGSTIFTDQPAPEATIINPAPLNVMDELVTQPADSAPPALKEPPTTLIDSVIVKHPLDQQMFIDEKQPIWVEFSTSPATSLPKGTTANVRLDDALVVTGSRYRMPIDVPERGAHVLQIQLVDQAGTIVAESDFIEIHVKQHVAGNAN